MMPQTLRLVAFGSAVCLFLAEVALAGPGWAQTQTIRASNAWARRAAAMGKMDMKGSMEKMDKMTGDKGGMSPMAEGGTGAVYVTLSNTGSQADALIAASSDAAGTVELHEVQKEGGVMKMRPVKSIPIPAGGKVELKPGAYHIMLLALKHDLKPGEKVPVTLSFEHGGELRIEAAVR
ncbi:MAG TPA: copper chaperone PCu(A)C [Candidatus Methylomirabilis sp.]|nr:copper chaperone PCu(A)C [Candidatus Methylomirabilis sp.]